MTWVAVLMWLRKHWQTLAVAGGIGILIVGGMSFYGSWALRGSTIERLEVELERAETEIRTCTDNREADREACAKMAQALQIQQEETAQWIERARLEREEYDRALDAAYRSNRQIRERIEAQSEATVEAVRRAEGCENKVTALAQAIVGGIE